MDMDPRFGPAISGMISIALEHATGEMALATAIDDANGRIFIGVMIPCDDMPESARARIHELNAQAAGAGGDPQGDAGEVPGGPPPDRRRRLPVATPAERARGPLHSLWRTR